MHEEKDSALAPSSVNSVRLCNVASHESTRDLNRERVVLLRFGIPTLFLAKFECKQTPDKILSPLFIIVNRSFI